MEKKDSGVLIMVLCFASLNFICCRPVRQQLQQESLGRESVVVTEKDIFYEDGFVVQTILDGQKINASIYRTSSVPGENYIFAVDTRASQILKLELPIDENNEIVRVAGSEDGEAGHKDGWGKASLFNHPTGLTVDDEGNVYVADARDSVIRKINHEGVVSTIAGESNVSGFADGEGRKARFSPDFDVTYISSICSLLVSDRGNRRLRLIELKKPEVCKPGKSSRGFSVGLEGLVFIISGTFVMSTITVLAFKNVNLREKVAHLQLVAHRLTWRRSDNDLYTPLENSGLPKLLPDGNRPPLRTGSLPTKFPDLIDLSYETSATDEARHAPPITQGPHYNRGAYHHAESSGSFPHHTRNVPRHPLITEGARQSRDADDDPTGNLGLLTHTQSAPSTLITEIDSAGDAQT